ncbi:hypothetical protein DSM25559_5438 [Agrobacterium rosae]|uniref:Uncharacterized protein n=1 Tax=Agrobacterium rosae TaxID=1972867 RepID=A0A1R3U3K5_9HYPH|nr:hypothetical protein DSM25559_5438 [Agrobacterium rosae]
MLSMKFVVSANRSLAAFWVLPQRRKSVVPLTKVYGFGRHHDPHAVRWKDHVTAAIARAMPTIRAANAPLSRRMVTGPNTISVREIGLTASGSGEGVSTTMAANSTVSSGSVKN